MQKTLGFTLLEIMITIAIIAIIAAIAIPAYEGYITNSRTKTLCSNLQNIRSLEEDYFLDNASYASCDQLGFSGCSDISFEGDYGAYEYWITVSGNSYTLSATHTETGSSLVCTDRMQNCTPSCN